MVRKSETTLHSKQAVLIGFNGIKVEVDTQSIEGDLYLRDTTNLSANDFKQALEQVEIKQASEDWLQPTLCFPKSK